MIKYSLILLFVCCVNSPIFSQTTINSQSKVISQVDSINQLAENLVRSHTDSAFGLTQKSIELATSIDYKLGEGIALINQSRTITYKGNFAGALTVVEKAISILEKIGNKNDLGYAYNHKGFLKERLGDINEALNYYNKATVSTNELEPRSKLSFIYNNLGGYYQRRGNHILALEYFNKTLILAEKEGDQTLKAICFSNIGNTHFFQKEYDKAIPYYEQAIVIQKKINEDKSLSQTYNNLGGTLIAQNKNEEALPYLKEAALLYKKTENTTGYLMTQINIGIINYNQNKYEEAIRYFTECLKLEQQITDKNTTTMIYNNLAACNIKQQNYDSAIVYAQKGLEIAKNIDAKKTIIDNLETLSIAYAGKKEFEKAHQYHVLYTNYKDSLFTIEKSSEINALFLEQKKLENIQLEQDNLLKNNALQKEQFERKAKEQAILILEKQAEADRLLALAKQATNKQEADSLYRAAKNAQLEADNLKIKAEKTELEQQAAQQAAQAKSDQKIAFQQNLSILFGVIVLAALLVAFTAYRNQRNKQKANLLLAEKNEEINLQNELLADSNQTKDRLFSIIAHDLRSPIAAFQSTSRQINFFLQKNRPEKVQEISLQIDSSAQHLNNLLNNLLNWVLTQQKQKIQVNKTTINLYESVEDILKSYQTIALAYDIDIKNTIPKGISIWVDTDTFQTIIRNLISNSLKYTPKNGSISLSIDSFQNENTDNEKVALKITDTGIGMSEKIKDKLTSKFMQLDLKHTQRGLHGEKSTGLGLVLCYEFATLNDIDMKLESKQDEGTTFYLLIPTSSKENV